MNGNRGITERNGVTGRRLPNKGWGAARPITKTEREIIADYARGLKTGEIALKRFISVKTVDTHRANILEKTRCRTLPEVILWAVRQGLLEV